MKQPSTSREAFKQSQLFAEKAKVIILEALPKIEPAHYEQIAEYTGLDKYTVGRRLPDLRKEKKVTRLETKKPTSSGCSAFCYELVK